MYKFHNYFDGLIGCDLLQKWSAKIDLESKKLLTKFTSNPLHMYTSDSVNLCETIIPANSSKLICVPTSISKGDICIQGQKIGKCHISECITTAKNNRAVLEISNPTDSDVIICLTEPIKAHIFNEQLSSPVSYDTFNNNARARDVLSRLHIDHLNAEETANIKIFVGNIQTFFILKTNL